MFKIYQIHEQGGEYEDSYDYIVGSYLYRERAERELKKLNAASDANYADYKKCFNCPAQFGCSMDKVDEVRETCENFATENDEESFILFCRNAVCLYKYNVRYIIEEIDVDEEEK